MSVESFALLLTIRLPSCIMCGFFYQVHSNGGIWNGGISEGHIHQTLVIPVYSSQTMGMMFHIDPVKVAVALAAVSQLQDFQVLAKINVDLSLGGIRVVRACLAVL